ncbi:RdgB/HAM1 family non-canonical purine NTP pyrophosphatase [Auraticoccus sp. F435]|uniref:dITP/XTP pyrophosphatase n=1 Tax=Auraticoccus cholistanensis TaxID=2656650 RepID=A0A6A9UYR3_9ACTN|nr:RdgB/HAM1 family non-canonical purine NTP pyrophosphatase [Auraticoccus cholistanensis]MVA76767.1 RdgB/HAM1 family non-canonical purine NTP pyrophosphatase [Auraticoccus cholistanensis]
MSRPRVVLATNNAKKLAELRRVVGDGVEVLALADVAPYPEPAETERTFEGNALLKARACVAATGLPALADDSGLEVDELGGMPGVRSARWAGRHGDDVANLELVLRQLEDVPAGRRTARFVCAVALALPDGSEHVLRRVWEGRLATAPAGANGFGYDPVFLPEGAGGRTAAQLSPEEKDAVSHRGQAVRAMAQTMAQVLGTGGERG